jgi:hypothetical protein
MRRSSETCALFLKCAETSARATSIATPCCSTHAYRSFGTKSSFGQPAHTFGNATRGSHSASGVDDIAASLACVPWSKLPTQIGVAMGVATFWRGAWYVMDGVVFPEDVGKSALASFAAGVAGLAGVQRIAAPMVLRNAEINSTPVTKATRYLLLYGIGISCVAVWRGTWLGWDLAHEKFVNAHPKATDAPIVSGAYSHVTAVVGLCASGYLSSVLAPPAVMLLINDEALRNKNAFLKGANWLFTKKVR